jgi:hypothetical protein
MQNIGTLISASIRPNDSLDPIASAYAVEIKGGLHTTDTSINRDAIIFERREWGMMCYVESDDLTYQLRYNYSSTNIMDNNNWVVFSGSGGGGGEWIDSVLSVEYNEPVSPNNGDRYLVGTKPGDVIKTLWNERSYEVADVGKEGSIFQLNKNVYEFILKPYRFSDQSESAREASYDIDGTLTEPLSAFGENQYFEDQSEAIDDYDDVDTTVYGY